MDHRQSRGMRLTGSAAALILGGLAAAFVASPGMANQADVAGPAPAAAFPTLRIDGERFSLEYERISRRQVLDLLFSAAGVTATWPTAPRADELVSGRVSGTLEEVATRLLSGLNYVAVYDERGDGSRLRSIVIHGAAPASPSEPDTVPAAPSETGSVAPACGEESGGCDGAPSAAAIDADLPAEEAVPPMNPQRTSFAVHRTAEGKVIVFGGEIAEGLGETTDRIEEYDPATGAWTLVGHLSQGKAGLAACPLADGRLLLVGGYNRRGAADLQAARSADLFDPASRATRPVAQPSRLNHAAGAKALKLPDGRCLIASETAGPALEFFDPATESFTQAPTPPASKDMKPGAPKLMNLLPDGRVLIVGDPSAIFDPNSGAMQPVPQR